ncbi:aromatic ring hydroxylase [Kribbella sandramycini]|uniref:2,4-dichlorophenol 6-monooxygenase n=1 Tax=Kribbella sandramycini TaxID=60450 RepID=A0A7Y4NZ63_9ACTN|nr:2,4-dichlorophenol 6-monooxygenase [Kribbella sandramycini]NOL39664.1 aromatic ring hydroxylase [Kribbella sandramycini]
MVDYETPVLIIGGGGAGLSASVFLSDLGVDHLMVERHFSTSPMPKAHYLNPRTMEIFRQHGLADEVSALGMPTQDTKVRYVTSLGGDGEFDQKEIVTFDAYSGGSLRERYLAAAPVPPTNFPQLRLEPVLRRHAEERGPDRVRFGQEVISLEQDATGVTARVRDLVRDVEYTVRSQYVIGADGGRFVGPKVGAVMEGPGAQSLLKTSHVTVDLSDYLPGDALITHVARPGSRFRWTAVVPMGPAWGKRAEEYTVGFAFYPGDEVGIADEDLPAAIREGLGLPDLVMKVHKGGQWLVERSVASRFRFDRVFLAGDAAHKHVPTGGLGLNSAFHDVHNLTWKLAAVLKGWSADPERLLQSYEDERRPADIRNADWALFTYANHEMVDVGLGMSSSQTIEENAETMAAYFADTPMGETLRARGLEVMRTQRTEYQALEIELGVSYESAAVVPDGTQSPPRDPMGTDYKPVARPGHRLPHAWLSTGGERVSTHDLVGRYGGFALLAGRDGVEWVAAAEALAEKLGVPIKTARIGDGLPYGDPTGAWGRGSGISPDGAVLVRPDNHVGYRAHRLVPDPEAQLEQALRAILSS